MQRRRTRALRSKWTAAEFNLLYPVGTRVRFQPIAGDEVYEERETRSEAWELGSGEPVVMLTGRTGGCALAHITVPSGS